MGECETRKRRLRLDEESYRKLLSGHGRADGSPLTGLALRAGFEKLASGWTRSDGMADPNHARAPTQTRPAAQTQLEEHGGLRCRCHQGSRLPLHHRVLHHLRCITCPTVWLIQTSFHGSACASARIQNGRIGFESQPPLELTSTAAPQSNLAAFIRLVSVTKKTPPLTRVERAEADMASSLPCSHFRVRARSIDSRVGLILPSNDWRRFYENVLLRGNAKGVFGSSPICRFSWTASIPSGTLIAFDIRTAGTSGTLSAAIPVTFTVPSTISPVNIGTLLMNNGQMNKRPYLRVTSHLFASPDQTIAPVLTGFELQFRCVTGE